LVGRRLGFQGYSTGRGVRGGKKNTVAGRGVTPSQPMGSCAAASPFSRRRRKGILGSDGW
ncbi:MAG: hypothetical protein WAU34_04265, partial [Desulfobacterales bacterium]